jgi:hypothetical protein
MSKLTNAVFALVSIALYISSADSYLNRWPVLFLSSVRIDKQTAVRNNSANLTQAAAIETNANRSNNFDTVERLVIGRKFAFTVSSNPNFLSSGVICPTFILFGKQPLENDVFAIFLIIVMISGTNNLSKDVGSTSSGDDLFGSFTSSVVKTPKSVKLAANKLSGGSSVVGSSQSSFFQKRNNTSPNARTRNRGGRL